MKKFVVVVFVVFFSIFLNASDLESNVKGFVVKVAKFAKKVGKVEAIKNFNNPKGKYSKGNLYIWAIGLDGKILSHSKDKILIGKKVIDAKDLDGKKFVKEILKAAKDGDGWVNYYWKNPSNKKIMKKRSYVLRVDNSYAIVGGHYIKK